jgi:polyisoprenoid-binding protein YceI
MLFSKTKIQGVCLLALALTTGPALAAEYTIDGSGAGMHASVNFHASHLGLSQLWGRFNDISGSFTYDPANIGATTINVRIDPASIDTNHGERDTHLRSADYLDVAKFPEAGFVSTAVHDKGNGLFHVHGNFTLHGTTKAIDFEAKRTGEGQSPWGDYRVGFDAEAKINAADFGIGNMGTNTMITLFLAIEGVRQ